MSKKSFSSRKKTASAHLTLTSKNMLSLTPDETYPNIIKGLKKTLLDIKYISGVRVDGQVRSSVTDKVFNRIHSYILANEHDKFVDFDDIITYMDNVSYVNKAVVPIIFKAVTGQDIPAIIMEMHMLNEFISDGKRSLDSDETPFFKKNYHANSYFLRQPSFSGSSVVHVSDMDKFVKAEKFETSLDDLIDYLERKMNIISVGNDFYMNYKSYDAESYIIDCKEAQVSPLIGNDRVVQDMKTLSDEQSEAVNSILRSTSKIECLTGPGGSGKSYVLSTIVENAHMNDKKMLCLAFTGKAAARISQSGIDPDKLLYPPRTIHSMMMSLKLDASSEPKHIDLIIIDEASTMNSSLFSEFITILKYTTDNFEQIKFLFVGDMNQLPPIGGGQIFEDILTLRLFPIHRLTKVFRTTDQSMMDLYNDTLATKFTIDVNKHKKFFKAYSMDNIGAFIDTTIKTMFEKDQFWWKDNKCIILAHTNKYIDYINYLCYKQLQRKTIDFYEYTFKDHPDDVELSWEPLPVFWIGAKIIFMRNDNIDVEENGEKIRVTNGSVGEVVAVLDHLVQIKSYDDGRVFYVKWDYPDVKLAYAMTVFKSQGSEAQFVIYFHSNHIFETKRLVYTAMTRARTNLKIYTPVDGFKLSKDVDRFTIINSN